ncbi:MAG: protein kinase [Planctomycetes bacterium]|nr:protein kinase [Planctomycetota bacterium]
MPTESPGPPGTPTRLSARLTDLYARKAVELGFCTVRQALAAVHARQRDPDGPTIDRLFVALGILSEAQAEDVRLAVRALLRDLGADDRQRLDVAFGAIALRGGFLTPEEWDRVVRAHGERVARGEIVPVADIVRGLRLLEGRALDRIVAAVEAQWAVCDACGAGQNTLGREPGATVACRVCGEAVPVPDAPQPRVVDEVIEIGSPEGAETRAFLPPFPPEPTPNEESVGGDAPDVGPLPSSSPPAPRDIGPYRVIREVGRGGMGVVYEAVDRELGRRVALKVIARGDGAETEEQAERFQREARAASKLDHPGIVKVYGAGEDAGVRYFAMEFVSGPSLADLLRDEGPLPPERAAHVVARVARALDYAHQRGVIHRDVKPANIMLREADGAPLITDFGLAREAREVTITKTGQILGTPAYMAPEQVSGERRDVGPASDQYSLGATLYELLSGRLPFEQAELQSLMLAVMFHSPPRLTPRSTGVPRALETIVKKTLEKDPRHRYATCAALAEDLEAFRKGTRIAARPPGLLTRAWRWAARNRRLAAAATVAAVLAPVAVGFYFRARWQGEAAQASGDRADAATRDREKAEAELRERERLAADARARRDAALPHLERGRALVEGTTNLDVLREALPYLNNAIREDAAWADAWYCRGRAYRRLAEYAAAIKDFRAALAADPAHFKARYELAVCLLSSVANVDSSMGIRDEAAREFEVLDTQPAAREYALVAKAYAALLAQRYEEALSLCDQAEAVNPQFGDLYAVRGGIFGYYLWGQSDIMLDRTDPKRFDVARAIADMEKAVKYDPLNRESLIVLARLFMDANRFDDAERLVARVLDLDASYARALFWRAHAHVRHERYEEALADLDRVAAGLRPTETSGARVYSTRGFLNFLLRRFEPARADLSLLQDGGRPGIDLFAMYLLSATCALLDDVDGAMTAWAKAEKALASQRDAKDIGRILNFLSLNSAFVPVMRRTFHLEPGVFLLPPEKKNACRTIFSFLRLTPESAAAVKWYREYNTSRIFSITRDIELVTRGIAVVLDDEAAFAKVSEVSKRTTNGLGPAQFASLLGAIVVYERYDLALTKEGEPPDAAAYVLRASGRTLISNDTGALADLTAAAAQPSGGDLLAVRYGIATIHARLGAADAALDALRLSARTGWNRWAETRADEDFRKVAGDSRFGELTGG